MIKVLHLFKTYYPNSIGGVEMCIYNIAQGGVAFGVQATVLSLVNEAESGTGGLTSKHAQALPNQIEDHAVYYAPLDFELASTGFSWRAISLFKRLAAQADIVHYHFPYPFADMLHLLCRIKKPCVLTYHSDIIKQKRFLKVYEPLMHVFLKRMQAIVATSPNYAKSSAVLQKYRDKVHIIPIGIEDVCQADALNHLPTSIPKNDLHNHFAPGDEKINALLRQHQITKPFFLFVGVLRYYKGIHVLLAAIAELLRTNPKQVERYQWVIAGGGALYQVLQQQMQALGLAEHVIFLYEVDETTKHHLLHACYAFVFPSHLRSEAFGISLVEAAMHGKAMIACEMQTGTSYINQQLITGLNVPPNDVDALKNALLTFMIEDAQVQAWGNAARIRYLSLFQSQVMVEQYAALYQTILHTSP